MRHPWHIRGGLVCSIKSPHLGILSATNLSDDFIVVLHSPLDLEIVYSGQIRAQETPKIVARSSLRSETTKHEALRQEEPLPAVHERGFYMP